MLSADELAAKGYELIGDPVDFHFYEKSHTTVYHRRAQEVILKYYADESDKITEPERTHTNQAGNTYVYELPFQTYDREHDMRVAYAEFERRLAAMEAPSGN